MKYLLILAALIAAFNGAAAADEQQVRKLDDPSPEEEEAEQGGVIQDAIRGFLSETFNTFQNVEIPTLGSGTVFSARECAAPQACMLLGGVSGMQMCRDLGGLQVSLCAPKVFDVFVAGPDDGCGCCPGQTCNTPASECDCPCQEGRGVMVKHDIIKILGRQISWNACYTPAVATSIMTARPEFSCYDQCPEAIAAAAAEAAAAETSAPST